MFGEFFIDETQDVTLHPNHIYAEGSKEEILNKVDSLLKTVQHMVEVDMDKVKEVANLVLKYGALQATSVGSMLLERLEFLPHPIPFVEIIPSLFGIASPDQLREVFKCLEHLAADTHLMLSVINAMVDLPLTPELKPRLIALTSEAMNSVDESDIPFLFRTLLNHLEHISASDFASQILKEVGICCL